MIFRKPSCFIITIILSSVAILCGCNTANVDAYYVSSKGSIFADGSSESKAFNSLQKAVDAAIKNNVSEIIVIGSIKGGITITDSGFSEILIHGLIGSSTEKIAILNGNNINNSGGILEVSGNSSIRLEDIEIKNGNHDGVKLTNGAKVTIGKNVKINNISGDYTIYSEYGNLMITDNTIISDNVSYSGSVVHALFSEVTIKDDVKFLNNRATVLYAEGGNVLLQNSVVFDGNSSCIRTIATHLEIADTISFLNGTNENIFDELSIIRLTGETIENQVSFLVALDYGSEIENLRFIEKKIGDALKRNKIYVYDFIHANDIGRTKDAENQFILQFDISVKIHEGEFGNRYASPFSPLSPLSPLYRYPGRSTTYPNGCSISIRMSVTKNGHIYYKSKAIEYIDSPREVIEYPSYLSGGGEDLSNYLRKKYTTESIQKIDLNEISSLLAFRNYKK